MHETKPLYRKVNRTAHGADRPGGAFAASRHSRNESPVTRGSMRAGRRLGLDYRPLFRFLISQVGRDWDAVYSEARRRLDRPEPIFWQVARSLDEGQAQFCYGESTYFSGLYIDANNRLALVAPELKAQDMVPGCACCTHTFNGEPFGRKYEAS